MVYDNSVGFSFVVGVGVYFSFLFGAGWGEGGLVSPFLPAPPYFPSVLAGESSNLPFSFFSLNIVQMAGGVGGGGPLAAPKLGGAGGQLAVGVRWG